MRARLSYANVMATVAVFVALGGGAYAALEIPKNSVGTKQLKKKAVKKKNLAKNSVDSSKIVDGSVGTVDLGAAAVDRGKLADNAVNGAKVEDGSLTAVDVAGGTFFQNVVVRETVVPNVGNNGFQVETITCNPGEKAISAGGGFTPLGTRNYSVTEIGSSTRLISPVDAAGNALADGQAPAGFLVSLQNVSGASRDYHGYVVCAQL